MSSSYVITRFNFIELRKFKEGYYIISKAENDDVIEIVTYHYSSPIMTTSSLKSIEYISLAKSKELGYIK